MQPRTCHLCCRTIAFTFAPRCILARVCLCVCEWLGLLGLVSGWFSGATWTDGWCQVAGRGQGFRWVSVPVQCCAFCLHCGFLPQLRPRLCCLRGLIERLSCPSTHLRIYPPCSCSMWFLMPQHIYRGIHMYVWRILCTNAVGDYVYLARNLCGMIARGRVQGCTFIDCLLKGYQSPY